MFASSHSHESSKTTEQEIKHMSFCVSKVRFGRLSLFSLGPSGPKLTKLNLTNLTLDTQNDIRSIPFRVEVGNETESLSDRS